ncbi:Transcriptional regulator GlxA family, contains an amidase domain and an AraC-type DNA-binding HTH domain [Luteibacter sp. UNCMF331Sha3.1]|uniref:GlxA family transcriptional regulator n=1 Tax=Luteibacter sp. UNCMF331Sha3.1 TaxID=1502760 RepID=UPI0008AB9C45|nr:helix-turn-helix domain-containing protein [Luteibacter sp. UNCMF331Sha3.1]SEN04922.1 Transcriptional regulator GlxA family, contains an amidase domain and an AraC-type DNA-binding HTH domain [Luteibacter sp. UNCMF331Sha3.1]
MHRVGYFLPEGFQVMAMGTQSVFEVANLVTREPVYQVTDYSIAGGKVRSSLGTGVYTEAANDAMAADTWMICGVVSPLDWAVPQAGIDFINEAARHARRVAGLCTGAFALGDAGLLRGRRATTHWAFANALRTRYPEARVEEDRIFTVDGSIWTSAGLTAAMDLALAMVENDLGHEVARSVAHALVMHYRRAGGQSQHSEWLRLGPKSDRMHAALDYARRNLAQSLTVDDLARAVHLSPRQFSRVFQAETGHSPRKAVEQLRLEEARNMIERGRHSLEIVARETGFRDRKHLREAFVRGYGITPQVLRRERRGSSFIDPSATDPS